MTDGNDRFPATNVSNPGQPIAPGDTFECDLAAILAQLQGNKKVYVWAVTYPQGWQPGEEQDVPWGGSAVVGESGTVQFVLTPEASTFVGTDPIENGDILELRLHYVKGQTDVLASGGFTVGETPTPTP